MISSVFKHALLSQDKKGRNGLKISCEIFELQPLERLNIVFQGVASFSENSIRTSALIWLEGNIADLKYI